jgi:hypothetical protein
MKIDPYKHKEKYLRWKEKVKNGIPNLSKANSNLIFRYLEDMQVGINISNGKGIKKGPRSMRRLSDLSQRVPFMFKELQNRFNLDDISQITEEQIMRYFSQMRDGTIKRRDGTEYKSVADYVRIFKAFWHWHMKAKRKEGKEIIDIAIDLDTSTDKPRWVYLSEEQVRLMAQEAKYEYRVLILFLFDTGIRAPGELVNIRVYDLHNSCKELNIRDEISKTVGRKIKLMLCSDLLNEYIKKKDLKADDQVFPINHYVANRYLQRLATKLFGDNKSQAGENYSKLTMYDFRHSACCYWLTRYKSESSLKYRFGWKKSDKIYYYSELIGMRDTISESDLLIDVTKTELEKRLANEEKENSLLKERVEVMENQMKEMRELVSSALSKLEDKKLKIS